MKIFFVFFILMIGRQAFAHGEDKLGPNGGYIRMPGAFHTELVPIGENKFKIYLLNMEWKSPSVKDSRVMLSFGRGPSLKAKCTVEKNFYICIFDVKLDLKNGELTLQATRESQVGNMVKYPLPLKLERSNVHDDHKT